jgi:phage tail sheath gpL-like
MASITVVINTKAIDSNTVVASGNRRASLASLANLIEGINGGANNPGATVDVAYSSTDPVAASGSVAITHANVTNGDTVTIGGVVITAATSGNGTSSWTIGASASADATAMAACINANTTLNKVVTASASSGTVTIACNQKGLIGNFIVMSTSDATAFALTQLTGGTGGVNGAFTSY